MLRLKLFFLMSWVVVGVAGCGTSGGPDTVKVTGKVTHNGAAVAGAMVSFSPEGGGTAAAGSTDVSGNFTLTTMTTGDGAVPGNYKVTVAKTEQEISTVGSEDDMDAAYLAAEAAGQDVMASGGGGAAGGAAGDAGPKDLLPVKYKSVTTTDLTAEVTKGGENNFEFDLK